MDFNSFVELSKRQDSRNVFSKCEEKIELVPEELSLFYEQFNPVDVEVRINDEYVRLFPYERIKDLQAEYSLKEECFVFATCNGDPIYLKDGSVYSCVFGKKGMIEELKASSIYDFFEMIAND